MSSPLEEVIYRILKIRTTDTLKGESRQKANNIHCTKYKLSFFLIMEPISTKLKSGREGENVSGFQQANLNRTNRKRHALYIH